MKIMNKATSTDTKSAAKFIQQCFDECDVALKVKVIHDDFQPTLEVSGEHDEQPVEFNIILIELRGEKPDVVFDVFAWPELSNLAAGEFEAMDALRDGGMKNESERKKRVEKLHRAHSDILKSANAYMEYATWLSNFTKAIELITSKYEY
jgi:hypothetical protein